MRRTGDGSVVDIAHVEGDAGSRGRPLVEWQTGQWSASVGAPEILSRHPGSVAVADLVGDQMRAMLLAST
jgi:hypothetical protein